MPEPSATSQAPADPATAAALIAFLASDRATPIAGAVLSIDFGLIAGY